MSIGWKHAISSNKSYIFLALIVLLTFKVLIPQLDELGDSLKALKDANFWWIFAAVVIYFTGLLNLTFQIMALSFKPLTFALTYRVEMAGQFVSKLLPSFVGVVTLNIYYLIKNKHTTTQAVTVMTVNAMTSFVAYLILTILALTQCTIQLDSLEGSVDIPDNLIYFIVIILLGIFYFFHRSLNIRSKVKKMWTDVKTNIAVYKKRRGNLLLSIFCNGLGSAANIFTIYAAAQAINIDLTLAEALLAYTLSNIATYFVPTPGGLGAAEAGLYAGLVFVGVDGANAITITLLYRLVSYWLPIIPGYLFFWGLRKNVLADFSLKKRYGT